MFSDESRFAFDFCNGRKRIWSVGERYTDPTGVAHDRYGGGSVMVWDGITMTGKTDLHVCTIATVWWLLSLFRLLDVTAKEFIFQDDKARAHWASVTEYLRQRNICTLPWPVTSPDLSPIEHVCSKTWSSAKDPGWAWCSASRGVEKDPSGHHSSTYWE